MAAKTWYNRFEKRIKSTKYSAQYNFYIGNGQMVHKQPIGKRNQVKSQRAKTLEIIIGKQNGRHRQEVKF